MVDWGERLSPAVEVHCRDRGYVVDDSVELSDGYRRYSISIPGRVDVVHLQLNGEVFHLSLPGGHSWMEFAYDDEDRAEALDEQLKFLDAYADPATREVLVQRWLRPPGRELHVSNGAVLRRRGVSRGPVASSG